MNKKTLLLIGILLFAIIAFVAATLYFIPSFLNRSPETSTETTNETTSSVFNSISDSVGSARPETKAVAEMFSSAVDPIAKYGFRIGTMDVKYSSYKDGKITILLGMNFDEPQEFPLTNDFLLMCSPTTDSSGIPTYMKVEDYTNFSDEELYRLISDHSETLPENALKAIENLPSGSNIHLGLDAESNAVRVRIYSDSCADIYKGIYN